MVYLLSCIAFALPSYLFKFFVFGFPTTILEILIYLSALITLILNFYVKKNRFDFNLVRKYLIPIALFAAAGIISTIIAPDKTVALGIFKAYIFDPIILFFVMLSNIKNQKDINLITNALICSGVIMSIYAIGQQIAGQITSDGRVLGIYNLWPNASPNYLSLYLAPILILIIAFQITIPDRSKPARHALQGIAGGALENSSKITRKNITLMYDLAFFICVYGLYLTKSRGAAISVIIALFILLIYKYRFMIKKIIWLKILIITAAFVGMIMFYQSIKPDFSLSPDDGGRTTSSNNIRWEIYKTTGEIMQTKWFGGVGLGNYQHYFTEFTKNRVNFPEYIAPYALTPHNLFLTIWVNLGALGIISFIWILISFFVGNFKSKQSSMIYMIVIFIVVIYGLIDTTYWKNDLSAFFWLILVMGVINDNQSYRFQK